MLHYEVMIKGPLTLIYNLITWPYILLIFSINWLTGPLISLFFKNRAWGYVASTFPVLQFWFLFLGRRTVSGLEHLPKEGGFIIASNHFSYVDIVLLQLVVKRHLRFIAKKELLKVPFLGSILQRQGNYLIDRQNPKVAIKQMASVKKGLDEGQIILIFPEGTRSVDGKVGPFKGGSFKIAIDAQVPIVPCLIEGTDKIFHKNSLIFRPGPMKVTFFEPILPAPIKEKKEAKPAAVELLEKTHSVISGHAS